MKDSELNIDSKDLAQTGGAAAKKLLKIVDDLLDAAKLEDGKFGYDFKEHDLLGFIDKLLVEAGPIAKEYNVNLFFSSGGGSASGGKKPVPNFLTFDEAKVGIALTNLIDNAIKYNVPNGAVTVDAKLASDPRFLQISVSDTGVGIPENDIKKLFTKFFRAENVMQFATEGSGLGLYVVKNIIMRHGGNIWVESQLHRGTTFYFTLPIDASLIPQKDLITEEES
jgi:signal transduction histidine kinase